MKNKIIATSMLFVIGITILISCTKNADTNMNNPASLPTPSLLAGDPAFIGLFDALNHFDPHYLQLVYKDQRSTEEIINNGKVLFEKLKMDPTNLEIQQQLAHFYQFNSVASLQYYSDQIVLNSNLIRNKYFSKDNHYTNEQVAVFMRARALYAEHKMDSVKNNTPNIKSSSMYDDYVLNPQAPAFQFFAEMDEEGLDNGGVAACSDACCIDLMSCKQQAARNFLGNSVNIGATLATGAGITGAGIASIFPVVGTIAGASVGVSVGSYFGVVIARQMYSADLYSCALEYKACELRKK